jgi:perosamine synthetase
MIPLSIPNLKGKELQYVKRCLDTNWVSSSGKFVADFENAIGKYVKAKFAVACVNGTSGLHIALSLCGVDREDEVIVPTLTFIAPVNAVKYVGAEPVFMDCDNYMNIDPVKLREFCAQECRITKAGLKNNKTGRIIKAVIPVHVFGNPCSLEEIMKISRQYRLKVIEDATESLGAYYTGGVYKNRFTGTIGDFGVYSFNGNKIITAGGGGMVITGNKALAGKAKYLSEQAKDDPVRYIHNEIGFNFRMTNLQAALGLAQLKQLKGFIKTKRSNYNLYKELLKNVDGIEILGIPKATSPNYWFYPLLIEKKRFGMDKGLLMDRLLAKGIQTRPVWYLNHLQKPYVNNQSYKIEKAFWFLQRVLNLPCSSSLKKNEIEKVASAIKILRNDKQPV